MRVVFAGTPQVAVASLNAVLASHHEVVAVLTRPDAPAGRGRRLAPSPVAEVALDAGIDVLRPASARDPQFLERLAELAPDAAPVVAFGGLIPPAALAVPRHGWVNLHFSILPAWRGAAPVQRAILAGDQITGASTFRLEAGLDTGPVFGVLTETIRATDTSGDLLERLAISGAGLLVATLDGIEDGSLVAVPQPADGVSLAPKLHVAEAHVPWDRPAMHVDRLIRACTPAPGAWTTFRGERLKLGPVRVPGTDGTAGGPPGSVPGPDAHLPAGTILVERNRVLVGTGSRPVELGQVKAEGKRMMPAADWARGVRVEPGESVG